jgi:hypothetical protein
MAQDQLLDTQGQATVRENKIIDQAEESRDSNYKNDYISRAKMMTASTAFGSTC